MPGGLVRFELVVGVAPLGFYARLPPPDRR